VIKPAGKLQIPTQPMLWKRGDDEAHLALLLDFLKVLDASFDDLEDAFDSFDVAKVGRLSVSNFQFGARSIGFRGDAKHLFTVMDAEKGGAITREEFFSLDRLRSIKMQNTPVPEASTSMTEPVEAGATTLPVPDSIVGFKVGRQIVIDAGTPQEEVHEIAAFGSIVLAAPLKFAHPAGASIVMHKEDGLEMSAPDPSGAQLLFEMPQSADEEWPSQTVAEVMQGRGEARFPGCAEELNWLFQEDWRRNQELFAEGSEAVAQKNETAAFEAAKAVEEDVDVQFRGDFPASLSRIQGTTSIDARVRMPDKTEKRMFLQTAVVDRTGTNSSAAEDAALVLEIRDPERGDGFTLCAQIDVSMILSINQWGSGSFEKSSVDVPFVINLSRNAVTVGELPRGPAGANANTGTTRRISLPGASGFGELLHIPEEAIRATPIGQTVFETSADGGLMLHISVGPSAWRRRDGIRFFDELRILMHFVADGVTNAASSIGAAAGAAANSASQGRRSRLSVLAR